MKNTSPYLLFNGNCLEAMQFYALLMGGELFKMAYSEVPDTTSTSSRMVHAAVRRGETALLMAADVPEDAEYTPGNNVQVIIDCDSTEEQDKLFTGLSHGGSVAVPLDKTFWGARFGMCTDRFGIHWMISYTLPATK